METLFIGADPEFLIVNKATRKPVPAHTFFPDKTAKLEAKWLDAEGKEANSPGKMFRDGYMLEVNINGTYCREILACNVAGVLAAATRRIGPQHEILPASAAKIDLTEMLTAPEDCKSFGCDPSWDAYTKRIKRPDIDAMTHEFRYGGGHMHFSVHTLEEGQVWDSEAGDFVDYKPVDLKDILKGDSYMDEYVLAIPEEHPNIIKMMDRYVGLPLSIIFNRPETFARRRYYGQAGEYRSQKYPMEYVGVEYRTPGPEMWTHEGIMSLAFGVARWVILNYGQLRKLWDPKLESAIQRAINHGEGMWDLVPEVPGFYNKETLIALEKSRISEGFQFSKVMKNQANVAGHRGWDDTSRILGLPIPDKKESVGKRPDRPHCSSADCVQKHKGRLDAWKKQNKTGEVFYRYM